MHSQLYVGRVSHHRTQPCQHHFGYSLFMMYLDLDELPTLFKPFWFWSYQRCNIASFDRSHYSGAKGGNYDLSEYIRDRVQHETGQRPDGPIRLLTHLRYFGLVINPVSFYYCFAADGETLCSIVAEINNTPWNEKHCYVLKVNPEEKDIFHFSFDKQFHVSPFNGMHQHYEWRFSLPSDDLRVDMKVIEEGHIKLMANLALQRRSINSGNLAKALLIFPFITGKVLYGIYYQALRLWIKRTPFHPHPKTTVTSTKVKPS